MRRSTRDAGVQPGVGEWRLAVAGRRRLGSPGAAGDAPWTAGVPGCGQQQCGWVAGPRPTTSWSWSAATRPLRSTGGRPGPESGALHAASARRAARVDDEKVDRGAARTLRRQGRVRIRAPTRTARTVRPPCFGSVSGEGGRIASCAARMWSSQHETRGLRFETTGS